MLQIGFKNNIIEHKGSNVCIMTQDLTKVHNKFNNKKIKTE